MAVNLSTHLPIRAVKTISGNQEQILAYLEASGQTWQPGTVVQIATSGGTEGFLIASTPSNGSTQVVAVGVAILAGNNLASNGAGASTNFGSIGYPGGKGAVQDIPTQSAAFSIYHGAPFIDGTSATQIANLDTIFEVQVDNSGGAPFSINLATTPLGSTIALNKDANGWWYADLAQVNQTAYADVNFVGVNPQDFTTTSTTVTQNNPRIWVAFNTKAIQGLQ